MSLLGTRASRCFFVVLGVGFLAFRPLAAEAAVAGVPGLAEEDLRRRRGFGVASFSSSVKPLKGTVVVVVLVLWCGLGWGVGEPNKRRFTLGPPTPWAIGMMPS